MLFAHSHFHFAFERERVNDILIKHFQMRWTKKSRPYPSLTPKVTKMASVFKVGCGLLLWFANKEILQLDQ